MYRNVPFRSLVVSLLASTAISGGASAVEPSGSAVDVNPAVEASGNAGGSRVLEIEGAVFMGDQIVASPNGLAQIRFIDNTRIVVGPNSRLTIDSFVFNQDQTARDVSVNMLKGAFRFMSGNSPHEAYRIRTPTMSIGVRGTVIDVSVRSGESSAVFLEGSGPVCDTGGNCIVAIDDCTLHLVTAGGGVQTPTGFAAQQRLAAQFPFIADQSPLNPAFRANVSSCSVPDPRFFGTPVESYGRKHDSSGTHHPYQ